MGRAVVGVAALALVLVLAINLSSPGEVVAVGIAALVLLAAGFV